MRKKVTFKEIQAIEDLEKCFLLRYRQFVNTAHRVFLKGKDKIDIDRFDIYSKHWGVFSEEGEIIGYARIIQEEKNLRVADHILAIGEKYAFSDFEPCGCKFPIFTYQTDQSESSTATFLNRYSHKDVFELSRFIIKKGNSFRISKFMVNAGLGIYKYSYADRLIILACHISHKKFWNAYGFKKIKEEEVYNVGSLKSVNLFSQLCGINERLETEWSEYANEFKLNNKVTIEI
ncbi:MAG: GNAT family N-acyltransferase [Bacteroidota bacterium]